MTNIIHRDHGKFCACPSPDPKTCYFVRYPNQMELDGRDYCECSCHDGYEDEEDCDCWDCAEKKIL